MNTRSDFIRDRTRGRLSPRAVQVLDYLQAKGNASSREALLDIDINSGSFTKRISELRKAGYKITAQVHRHPVSKRRYVRYTYHI